MNFFKNGKGKKITTVTIVVLYSTLLFVAGAFSYRNREVAVQTVKSAILYCYQTPLNYFKGSTTEQIERISIEVNVEDFERLQSQREIALSKSVLVAKKYVPATISYQNRTYKVKLRLKGDHIDHLVEKKWSFRIKAKGDATISGMKQFSIHHPKTRNYIYEWLFHKALKREDVIYLRYNFIEVVLNGENLGIYAIEEHFEKRLIENNQRKEGPIIRFNESLMWDETVRFYVPYPNAKESGYGSYLSSDVDAFQTGKYLKDTAIFSNYSRGISLLESFRNAELSTKDVFDIDKLSSFFAITEIMGAEHGSRWHNTRFYYNPITSKLEPIGFDGDSGQRIASLFATRFNEVGLKDSLPNKSAREAMYKDGGNEYYRMLFRDRSFYSAYINKLVRYSNKAFLDSIFDEMNAELDKNLNILQQEWPEYQFDRGVLYLNQTYVRDILNPEKALHSYLINKNENQIELAFGNIQSMPVRISSIMINDSVSLLPKKEIILPGKILLAPVEYHHYYFTIPEDVELTDKSIKSLRVRHQIYGMDKFKKVKVFPWNYLDRNLMSNDFIRKAPNISEFDFIDIDQEKKRIRFKPGNWEITKSIHIPKGYSVSISEGTKLNLINSAVLLSYSPLSILGTDERPVIITSSDSTGQGIFILKTNEKSSFEHVQCSNLSNPSKNGWELSGAVTFYEADVSINNCIFTDNRGGDDCLNIIRSEFEVKNTFFSGTPSDGIDVDFSKGVISNSSFLNCGNDAIDISGSVLTIDHIFIDNAGDKGLSVGENSQLIANTIKITNSEVAVCSKDMSEIVVADVILENNKIGFTAYQKKSEFGPANISGSKVLLENISIPYLIEANSSCEIDGVFQQSSNDANAASLEELK